MRRPDDALLFSSRDEPEKTLGGGGGTDRRRERSVNLTSYVYDLLKGGLLRGSNITTKYKTGNWDLRTPLIRARARVCVWHERGWMVGLHVLL